MDERVKKELMDEEPSEFHQKMKDSTLGLIQQSQSFMSNWYTDWDEAARVYRGERVPNKDDVEASKRREPESMVVPLSFAQVQTFIAFCFLLLTQNQKFYELEPNNDDDYKIRDAAEKFLKRDLQHNRWSSILFQFLLDAARFNIGVVKIRWDEQYQWVATEQMTPGTKFMGIPLKDGKLQTVMQKILKYEGNNLMSVSPYRWFPDVRLPLDRFQEGEYCGCDDEYSLVSLKQFESDGVCAGTKYIPNQNISDDNPDAITGVGDDRRLNRPARFVFAGIRSGKDQNVQKSGSVIITECQRKIVPSEFMLSDGKPLGDEDYPVKYVVWLANYQRVIKCEPMNNLHDQFTYAMGQFSPDIHRTLGPSLSGIIDQMQELVSWFINSRTISVRKSLMGKFIVDSSAVEEKSLESRSPYIKLKKTYAASGVDKWIKQLETQDVTASHVADADAMAKMIQVITGVNDNAMGQYNSGRRSATEARAVTSGAASRLKTIVAVMWANAFSPQGGQMLSNLRQGVSPETWMRVMGKPPQSDPIAMPLYMEMFNLFKADPAEIIAGDDFFVFDATLPSEKGFIAQSLQEMVGAFMTNPESMMLLNDPNNPLGKMMKEVLELRGVSNVDRFFRQPTPPPAPPIIGQPVQPRGAVTSNGNGSSASPQLLERNQFSAFNQ